MSKGGGGGDPQEVAAEEGGGDFGKDDSCDLSREPWLVVVVATKRVE